MDQPPRVEEVQEKFAEFRNYIDDLTDPKGPLYQGDMPAETGDVYRRLRASLDQFENCVVSDLKSSEQS